MCKAANSMLIDSASITVVLIVLYYEHLPLKNTLEIRLLVHLKNRCESQLMNTVKEVFQSLLWIGTSSFNLDEQ